MHKTLVRTAAATSLIAATALVGGGVAGGQTEETQAFGYTGEPQSFTVPADVCSIEVDAFGASGNAEGDNPPPPGAPLGRTFTGGGDADIAAGGLGGRATASVDVTPGAVLNIYVGGQGGGGAEGFAGGFNGGGAGGPADQDPGGGGGGASDVRSGSGTLADRLVVAGGGGGGGGDGFDEGQGGDGGGTTGEDGQPSDDGTPGGDGGTQNAGGAAPTAFDPTAENGALGLGGAGGTGTDDAEGTNDGGGGGGGGYYGGGGGAGDDVETDDGGGGGGGSGVGPDGVTFETGVNDGDGSVTLTWTVDPGCGDEPTTTTAATEADAAVRPTFTG